MLLRVIGLGLVYFSLKSWHLVATIL